MQAAYIGTFGNDARGDFARRMLVERGVDVQHSLQYAGRNAFTTITGKDGARRKVVGEPPQELRLDPEDIAYINSFDLVYLNSESHADAFLQAITARKVYDFSTLDDDKLFKRLRHRLILPIFLGKHGLMMMWKR